MINIRALLLNILNNVDKFDNIDDLNVFKSIFFGKNGIITKKLKFLKYNSHEYKLFYGKIFNEFKTLSLLNIKIREKFLFYYKNLNVIDYTLPSRGYKMGSFHPVTMTIRKIESFFLQLGFRIVSGPEMEDEYHNFEALNISSDHPARDMHDTFYFTNGKLLRTHTSAIQIREMLSSVPPFKLISLGKVYRRDHDNTHTPMFHQIEGLVVDKDITFLYLKNLINEFLENFFTKKLITRFRSSYFPFTEPSMEVDIECFNCYGKKCKLCSYSGWIELLGCGIVDPIVLNNCNIDHEIYSGIAFGVGIDRLSMLFYNIDDLRLHFENNVEFLEQL
ncbi:MAG: phenylalanine--tRNA ligase subunit alpha [Candidatus Azosocius agrarius]|nr:MAG: phenylalanine--tRNA ligase subunit alpha [Gammaproteobacteria bacterium]